MKTKTMLMWGVGAAAAVGLGLAMIGNARAGNDSGGSKDDGNGNGGGGDGNDDTPVISEVRHGIRHEGCKHFEVVDPDAVEAWARDNAWHFATWALRLDEVRANPEPAIVDALTLLFPECSWPPPASTTFEAQRYSWTEAMAMAKQMAATMDMAAAPGVPSQDAAGAFIGHLTSLAFGGGRR